MTSRSHTYAGTTAIAGIGATEFSKDSGRSELSLAVEAVAAALEDAGLAPSDVDGMVTYSADTNPDIDIARSLGIGDLTFLDRVHYGGGACCGTVQHAAMAVATGVADVVVCYRAFNERSGHRFGTGVQDRPVMPTAENAQFAWYSPFGLLTPASWAAMFARRYMHATGATSEDLGRIAVADRRHAATNPKAFFYGFQDIACATATTCSAGGQYRAHSGLYEGFIADEVNGTWRTASELALPAGATAAGKNGGVVALSCVSAGNCRAGAAYLDAAGHYQGLVVSQVNGRWSTGSTLVLPGGATSVGVAGGVYALVCHRDNWCTATGSYLAGGSTYEGFSVATN